MKLASVIAQQSLIGSYDDTSQLILRDTIEVIGIEFSIAIVCLFGDGEVVAIIYVETISGRNPDKAIAVLKHLGCKITGELVVCIKQLSTLRPCQQGAKTCE